jgi:hypothetical protein
VNDFEKYDFVVEGVEFIARLIARYAIFESLYLQRPGSIVDRLREALVRLYGAVLKFLSKSKAYYEQNTLGKFIPHTTHNVTETDRW